MEQPSAVPTLGGSRDADAATVSAVTATNRLEAASQASRRRSK